ncbi:uncharacterized protein LOC128236844 [Mya arenaria]|nr:uncharacterized protein LOC128236844 [Mya arenaria]
MVLGAYLYRLLRSDEDTNKDLVARKPTATEVTVESHIMGKKDSPYISTCANKATVEMFVGLAKKKDEKKKTKITRYTVVQIDVEKLKKAGCSEIIDLTDPDILDKEIKESNKRARNYATKYKEVLIKSKVPASCFTVLPECEESSDYEISDYTSVDDDIDSLASGVSKLSAK